MKTGEKTLLQDSGALLGEGWHYFQLAIACSG